MRILLANTGHPATIKGGAEAAVLDQYPVSPGTIPSRGCPSGQRGAGFAGSVAAVLKSGTFDRVLGSLHSIVRDNWPRSSKASGR